MVAETARGELAVIGESRLRIEGARGVVRMRGCEEGILRFASTAVGDDKRELPVTLLSDGVTLFAGSGEAAEPVERDLWVAVPPGFGVTIEIDGGQVALSDVQADFSVRGKGVNLIARRVEGTLEIDIQGGSARLSDVGGGVDLSGAGLEVELLGVSGDVDLSLQKSRVGGGTFGGAAVVRVVDSVVKLGSIEGTLTLEATGGSAEVEALRAGGELHLEGTPLVVKDSEGVIAAETDAEVRLENLEEGGAVQIRGLGAQVRGVGIKTSIDVQTSDAAVVLESVDGRARIEGSGLDVRLKLMRGELGLVLSNSGVDIEAASAKVSVENDVGEVVIRGSQDTVTVRNQIGNVSVAEAEGPVEVEVDEGDVNVEWLAMPRSGDSLLRTDYGNVDVTIAGRGGGWQLDARSRRGKVYSDHPDVHVTDNGEFASSVVRGAPGARLKIDCGGDVSIHGASAPRP